jgi:transcriptional regulator with XRE-family HTH domain
MVVTGVRWQAGGVNERSELADFLRTRRERLQPADVGLRDVGRRRTPGLRREEVATLAGVSIDYLVRIEQGRDLHPSPAIIAALATALQLTHDERMHLAKLAVISNNGPLCPASTAMVDHVPSTVLSLLERLDRTPAFFVGPLNDVLAWNDSWQALVRPLGLVDDDVPNLARHAFMHPSARTIYPDWSWVADEQVGRLRAASTRWREDERFVALLNELMPNPEFGDRWLRHTLSERHRGVQRMSHPRFGELRLSYEVLHLGDDAEHRLITWIPADEATTMAIDAASNQVAVSPANLRVVRPA